MKFFRFTFLLAAFVYGASGTAVSQDAPAVLETVSDINALTPAVADLGYDVAFQAVVVHCADYEVTYCTVIDGTGSIVVRAPAQPLSSGMSVQIRGKTEAGWVAPAIAEGAEIIPLGEAALPETLDTIEAVRKLSLEESSLGYPVRLTGVITYCTIEGMEQPHCFMQDDTGGIYFNFFDELPPSGARVQLTGVTLRGWFAPDIAPGAHLTVVGEARLPEPSSNPDFYLLRGKEDAIWVDAVGLVQQSSIGTEPSHLGLTLKLATSDKEVVTVFVNSMEPWDDLVGAVVKVQGVAGGFFNLDRQLTGIQMRVPDTTFVEIVSPGFGLLDAELVRQPLNKVLSFSLEADKGHLVRVAGTVIFEGDDYFVIQDAESPGIIYADSAEAVAVGDSVEVTGFPEVGGLTPTLVNAKVRPYGKATVMPTPLPLRIDALEFAAVNASLVEITGEVQEVIELQGVASYLLKTDNYTYEARIDGAYVPTGFRAGSTVRVKGIAELLFIPRYDDIPEVHPVRLHLRSTADMELLAAGPWWTPTRTRWLSFGLLVLLGLGLGWTILMRQKINVQTRTIRDKLEEVERLKDEAEVASRAKSAFLASMSHEIRTPLNGVIGFTSLLKDTPLNDEQHDFVSTIHTSGDALLSIINDILDFSKIEAGKLDLESRPFYLHQCIEEALDIVSHRAFDKGLDLAYYIDPEVPQAVMGDVTRLRQVIINLLSNGIKFTAQGEVNISVLAEEKGDQYELVFAVQDTGIGIPKDRLESIFASFSQADSSTTRRFGGTGLGLAICRRLSELMGGRIWVESVEGKGSTFFFSILTSPAEMEAEVLVSEKQHVLVNRRVLIVDDNETNRKLLLALCQQWQMEPVIRSSAAEVMASSYDFGSIDLALLDYMMPDVDGLQLAAYLREHNFAGPILIISSSGDRNVQDPAVNQWMSKPIKQNSLRDLMIKSLEAQRSVPQKAAISFAATGESLPGLRIAMAEKNRINMKIAVRLLNDLGYHAETFATAETLLENLQASPFDLAIVDEDLYTEAGINVLDELALGLDKTHLPRLVVLTNVDADVERSQYKHITGYLSKPLKRGDLEATLKATPRRSAFPDVSLPES
ncbi:MAG: ATP-binding protein [Bacteroidota bacterium]